MQLEGITAAVAANAEEFLRFIRERDSPDGPDKGSAVS